MKTIYELSRDGVALETFLTAEAARDYATDLPAGTYRIAEYETEYDAAGDYRAHYHGVNLCTEFYNWNTN